MSDLSSYQISLLRKERILHERNLCTQNRTKETVKKFQLLYYQSIHKKQQSIKRQEQQIMKARNARQTYIKEMHIKNQGYSSRAKENFHSQQKQKDYMLEQRKKSIIQKTKKNNVLPLLHEKQHQLKQSFKKSKSKNISLISQNLSQNSLNPLQQSLRNIVNQLETTYFTYKLPPINQSIEQCRRKRQLSLCQQKEKLIADSIAKLKKIKKIFEQRQNKKTKPQQSEGRIKQNKKYLQALQNEKRDVIIKTLERHCSVSQLNRKEMIQRMQNTLSNKRQCHFEQQRKKLGELTDEQQKRANDIYRQEREKQKSIREVKKKLQNIRKAHLSQLICP